MVVVGRGLPRRASKKSWYYSVFSLGGGTKCTSRVLGVGSLVILKFTTKNNFHKFSFFGHVMVEKYTNFGALQKAQFACYEQILW